MVRRSSIPTVAETADALLAATKADVEAHFATHGTGEITEVKLMNGFGFIEYKDPMDARDVVPGPSHPRHSLVFLYADDADPFPSFPYVTPAPRPENPSKLNTSS